MIKGYDYTGHILNNDRWLGKKIVFFGDSRTWWDGHVYSNDFKSEWIGKTCKGFQSYVVDLLGIEKETVATGGYHSYQICDSIKEFNFSSCDGAFFDGGINDWAVPGTRDTVGELAPIGSTFDLNTIYGNWQSAVEYVLNNYPATKIFLCVPYIGWTSGGTEFPYSYAKIKKDIAEIYNLPCIDLYKTSGLNQCNRTYYFGDTNMYIHLNDYGYKLIGEHVAGFIDTN